MFSSLLRGSWVLCFVVWASKLCPEGAPWKVISSAIASLSKRVLLTFGTAPFMAITSGHIAPSWWSTFCHESFKGSGLAFVGLFTWQRKAQWSLQQAIEAPRSSLHAQAVPSRFFRVCMRASAQSNIDQTSPLQGFREWLGAVQNSTETIQLQWGLVMLPETLSISGSQCTIQRSQAKFRALQRRSVQLAASQPKPNELRAGHRSSDRTHEQSRTTVEKPFNFSEWYL